jgi:DNA mismatch endonuclease (patch repair protein)
MSRIKGQGTKPEKLLRKALWSVGLRYRIKNKLPGRPDIIFPSEKVAVFVDGCFWHACPKHMTWPKNNADFWRRKVERNVERDREVEAELERLGWKWLRFWEHEISSTAISVASVIAKVLTQMKGRQDTR